MGLWEYFLIEELMDWKEEWKANSCAVQSRTIDEPGWIQTPSGFKELRRIP